ncbi:DUF2895 family protein [Aliivibrio fischeri]|uniref:DUF2895 family protein n=1 Tax=Aliivibrio fischeri TaxID=668 RepID=UPI0007C4502F|nr:DUF2895 family protein [Aliivibrio fischeri]
MNAKNKLAARDKVIAGLCLLVLLLIGLIFHLSSSLRSLPEKITVDQPPSASLGAIRKLGERDPFQVEGFAVIVHRILNEWNELDHEYTYTTSRKGNEKDLPIDQAIDDYRCLVTPEFREELKVRALNYKRSGDYFGQERIMTPILDKQPTVYTDGANRWVVDLPMTLKEYWRGKKIQETNIQYQYKVVEGQASVDCESSNRWGFLLAGYLAEPRLIKDSIK